jgi:hypothetical protein
MTAPLGIVNKLLNKQLNQSELRRIFTWNCFCQSDFYEFACGGFLKETVIPDDKTSEGRHSSSFQNLFSIKNVKTPYYLTALFCENACPHPNLFFVLNLLYTRTKCVEFRKTNILMHFRTRFRLSSINYRMNLNAQH